MLETLYDMVESGFEGERAQSTVSTITRLEFLFPVEFVQEVLDRVVTWVRHLDFYFDYVVVNREGATTNVAVDFLDDVIEILECFAFGL